MTPRVKLLAGLVCVAGLYVGCMAAVNQVPLRHLRHLELGPLAFQPVPAFAAVFSRPALDDVEDFAGGGMYWTDHSFWLRFRHPGPVELRQGGLHPATGAERERALGAELYRAGKNRQEFPVPDRVRVELMEVKPKERGFLHRFLFTDPQTGWVLYREWGD